MVEVHVSALEVINLHDCLPCAPLIFLSTKPLVLSAQGCPGDVALLLSFGRLVGGGGGGGGGRLDKLSSSSGLLALFQAEHPLLLSPAHSEEEGNFAHIVFPKNCMEISVPSSGKLVKSTVFSNDPHHLWSLPSTKLNIIGEALLSMSLARVAYIA